MLDIASSLQLPHAPHVKKKDKVLFRRIMVGGVWNGFLLGHARGKNVPCRFYGGFDGAGRLFWGSPHSPLVRIRENPEFHDLIQRDKKTWPTCLLWHGWLPVLGCNVCRAIVASGSVSKNLENKLGAYFPYHLECWFSSEEFVSGTTSGKPASNPDVWTDGSLVKDDVAGFCCGGAGVHADSSGSTWGRRSWVQLELLPPGDNLQNERCRLFLSIHRPVQFVQRAELWGVVLVFQAAKPIHIGVDNANGVGHVGQIIVGKTPPRPFQLLIDGNLLSLIQKLVFAKKADSTAIFNVKGHVDEGLVRRGQVRLADKIGNGLADEAADIGRQRVVDFFWASISLQFLLTVLM